MKKFVLLTASEEPNIAVLQIDMSDDIRQDKAEKLIKEIITEKATKALAEHFDADVKINSIKNRSHIPIQGEMNVTINRDEDDSFELTVEINETWVY